MQKHRNIQNKNIYFVVLQQIERWWTTFKSKSGRTCNYKPRKPWSQQSSSVGKTGVENLSPEFLKKPFLLKGLPKNLKKNTSCRSCEVEVVFGWVFAGHQGRRLLVSCLAKVTVWVAWFRVGHSIVLPLPLPGGMTFWEFFRSPK